MNVMFTVPGEPTGKARPRFFNRGGKSMAITPQKTVMYENLIKTCFIEQCGTFFGESPLIMRIQAYYMIPKSASKKKLVMMEVGIIRPTKKPDADNVAKGVADSLNGIAYKDDSQIVTMNVEKFYSDAPRVVVEIEKWEGPSSGND